MDESFLSGLGALVLWILGCFVLAMSVVGIFTANKAEDLEKTVNKLKKELDEYIMGEEDGDNNEENNIKSE